MSGHPVLDLGAAVRVLNDGQAWEIGVDHLDVDTYLAGGEAGGALLDLTPHLIEAQWVQGTGDAVNPDGVLPRGEAGTATLTLWDPTGEYMPPTANPFGGVRPGRRVVLYERDSARNPATVLWAGWVEQLERETSPDGPSTTVITAVDSITKLVNSVPTPPDARSPETAYERAVWASDVLTPGLPALLDPAATAATVAGTQVGDSAWKTLVDAADVELGALFTLRDGTLVMLANSAGEFTSRWQATWKHGDRDALLHTAAWWVDSAYPTVAQDGLRDLTGQGRDALFGADAATPRVLPWNGETYLGLPGDPGNGARLIAVQDKWTVSGETLIEFTLDRLGVDQYVMVWNASAAPSIMVSVSGSVRLLGIAGNPVTTYTLDVGQRYRLRAVVTPTRLELWDYDTLVWSDDADYTPTPGSSAYLNIGAAASAFTGLPARARVYYASSHVDGVMVAQFDPANVNAAYTKITNTGTIDGDWTVIRATTGWKTAVVDRPMLLFGGGQTLTSPAIPDGTGTLIHSVRVWGAPRGPSDLISVHDGSPVILDGTYEHLGSALFDRVLTDEEIQQLSAELLSDYPGQVRVTDLGDRFQVTVSPTPTTGTWTPPAVGDVLTVTRPQASEFHIHGTVLSSAQDGPYWTFTLTHHSCYWPGVPPPGTIVNVASLDWTTDPPGTPQWTQPECAPARISALTYDLASLRNDIHIRRRDTDSDLTPFTHLSDGESVGHYGRWTWQWDGSPHDDQVGEARSAALTLSAYALPRAVYAALEVNVTAAANTPHADTLLDLVRTVNLSNTITAHADGQTALARVYGWDWTWTAAGGLSGQVTLGRPPGAPTPGLWFMGIAGMSELDETTILA